MDPVIMNIDDLDTDDDDDDIDDDNEYGAAIPEKPFMLHADGDIHDLRDPDQVLDLIEQLKELRAKLKNGELSKYEGRSTEWGDGGRARLLHDSVMTDLAQRYHEGENNMSWADMHRRAMTVVGIVAAKNRSKF